jgi:hypothetical protein
MTGKSSDNEAEFESRLDPIWPGLKPLGYKTRSAAYAAVRRGVIDPGAIVMIGHLKRIKRDWVARKTRGK